MNDFRSNPIGAVVGATLTLCCLVVIVAVTLRVTWFLVGGCM